MALDSAASFKARKKELGLPPAHIEAFEGRQVKTYATFAFISPYQPNSADEKPFADAIKDILGAEPGDYLPTYRRLFYEAHTMAVQDLRLKLDTREGQEPRKLAMPERMERLSRLKASLTGLTLDAQLEPSHSLVDCIVAMAEEQSVYYVELALCTSRETEVNMLKKEPALEFTSDGAIRLSKRHREASADTTGELRVRLCMQRRALAFQDCEHCFICCIGCLHFKAVCIIDEEAHCRLSQHIPFSDFGGGPSFVAEDCSGDPWLDSHIWRSQAG